MRAERVGHLEGSVDVGSHVTYRGSSDYCILTVRNYLNGKTELLLHERWVMKKADFEKEGVKSPKVSLVGVLALCINGECCVSTRIRFLVHQSSGVQAVKSSWVCYQVCWDGVDAITASNSEITVNTFLTKCDSVIRQVK